MRLIGNVGLGLGDLMCLRSVLGYDAGICENGLGDGSIVLILGLDGGLVDLLDMYDMVQRESILDKNAGIKFRLLDAIGNE